MWLCKTLWWVGENGVFSAVTPVSQNVNRFRPTKQNQQKKQKTIQSSSQNHLEEKAKSVQVCQEWFRCFYITLQQSLLPFKLCPWLQNLHNRITSLLHPGGKVYPETPGPVRLIRADKTVVWLQKTEWVRLLCFVRALGSAASVRRRVAVMFHIHAFLMIDHDMTIITFSQWDKLSEWLLLLFCSDWPVLEVLMFPAAAPCSFIELLT